jgi:hypothetical protein
MSLQLAMNVSRRKALKSGRLLLNHKKTDRRKNRRVISQGMVTNKNYCGKFAGNDAQW